MLSTCLRQQIVLYKMFRSIHGLPLILLSPVFGHNALLMHTLRFKFGTSPHALAASGAFTDKLTKTEGMFEMTLLAQKKSHFKSSYTPW